jgi:hypothetical protein
VAEFPEAQILYGIVSVMLCRHRGSMAMVENMVDIMEKAKKKTEESKGKLTEEAGKAKESAKEAEAKLKKKLF